MAFFRRGRRTITDPGAPGPDTGNEQMQFQSRAQLMLNRLRQARQFAPDQAPLFNQPGPGATQPGPYSPGPGFRSRRFNRANFNQVSNPQTPHVPPLGPS